MGGGVWTSSAFNNYTTAVRGISADAFTTANLTASQVYQSRNLHQNLDPSGVMRECCDSAEHPNTLPVILALDVTGSMGTAAVKVAQKLNTIMSELYSDNEVEDIEFCVMGIGDIDYDEAPIQISQFESDIRIAEQMDMIWFEGRGGGNISESYSAAWYMGLNHCDLDCWKRGKKGIIITLGDELPNPYLDNDKLFAFTGDGEQTPIKTEDLLAQAKEKFNIYHISVDDSSSSYSYHQRHYNLDKHWKELLGKDNYFVANLDNLSNIITNIIKGNCNSSNIFDENVSEISW